MKKSILFLVATMALAACNSVSLKPDSMIPGQKVYAKVGGFSMRRSIKDQMEKRGYKVVVGRTIHIRESYDADGVMKEIETYSIPKDARYAVNVYERRERFNPFWCPFNGFWWWNFYVSIGDQKTGEELMTWRGRGCANSSLRKLDAILDKMEKKDADAKAKK